MGELTEDGYEDGYPNKIFKTIGKKWVFLIIREINEYGKIRFNQLKSKFEKVTSSQLSAILKELEEYGLINKEVFQEQQPKVEYSLTKNGIKFLLSINPLLLWLDDEKDASENISHHKDPKISKALVSLAVEKTLLEMNVDIYEKVVEQLESKYKSYLPDCYDHPEHLNQVLKDLFGSGYLSIIKKINENLDEFSSRKQVVEFLEKLGKL